MDLETKLNSEQIMEPISVSSYCPRNEYSAMPWISDLEYKTYYVTDYASSNEMVSASILDLLIPSYNGYHVYLHNFSKFDAVFILKSLVASVDSKDISFLVRDRNLLNVTVYYSFKDEITGKTVRASINFYDSLLIVPGSLSNLAKNFGVTNKGEFDISKYTNISIRNLFNIRSELLNYNKRDCKVLYEILLKFAFGIHEQYKINITTYPTLSSIAFAI